MSYHPLVSVVTPSYNQGQFIEDTILSVKNQRYPNIEHIIVDGGSTDNTLDVLREYENTYKMHWIFEPDDGQTDAINKGFAMVSGEIIGWLNSDDMYFDRDTISNVVTALLNRPDASVIYGHVALIDENNRILKLECFPQFKYRRMLRRDYVGQPATFFRRFVIESHKLNARLQFAMDYEFWLRLGKTYRFFCLNRILAADRNHRDRKIIAQRELMVAESIRVMKQYGQQFGFSYYLGRLQDKILVGAVGRLKGAYQLLRFSGFSYDDRFVQSGPLLRSLLNQLCRKNSTLC